MALLNLLNLYVCLYVCITSLATSFFPSIFHFLTSLCLQEETSVPLVVSPSSSPGFTSSPFQPGLSVYCYTTWCPCLPHFLSDSPSLDRGAVQPVVLSTVPTVCWDCWGSGCISASGNLGALSRTVPPLSTGRWDSRLSQPLSLTTTSASLPTSSFILHQMTLFCISQSMTKRGSLNSLFSFFLKSNTLESEPCDFLWLSEYKQGSLSVSSCLRPPLSWRSAPSPSASLATSLHH